MTGAVDHVYESPVFLHSPNGVPGQPAMHRHVSLRPIVRSTCTHTRYATTAAAAKVKVEASLTAKKPRLIIS